MKKLVLTGVALLAGGVALVNAQGFISLQETTAGTVITNGTSIGQGSGNAFTGNNTYYYDILDMTSAQWSGLSANQQTGAANLMANPSDVTLWTDSGVTGINTSSLTRGGIAGAGSTTGASASNWAEPTSQTAGYSSAASYDYYVVVGWSVNEGTSWSTVSSELTSGTLVGVSGWFGESAVLYNYAGGNGLSAPNVFSPAATTGLAGSGVGAGVVNPELVLMPIAVPEPATLALAGLGGVLMLLLRRHKS